MIKYIPSKPLDVLNVSKVYSGRSGCACGCRGKYAIPSTGDAYHDAFGDVSDRSVKIIVSKINARLSESDLDIVAPCNVAVDDGNRLLIAYLRKPIVGRVVAL